MATATVTHEPDNERLAEAFFAEDTIGAVIRSHFEIECAINHLFEQRTAGRYGKNENQFRTFRDKLTGLILIKASADLVSALKIVNGHRNHFAHRAPEELPATYVRDLLGAVRRVYPKLTDDFVVIFKGKKEFNRSFGDLNDRQKYVALCMVLMFEVAKYSIKAIHVGDTRTTG